MCKKRWLDLFAFGVTYGHDFLKRGILGFGSNSHETSGGEDVITSLRLPASLRSEVGSGIHFQPLAGGRLEVDFRAEAGGWKWSSTSSLRLEAGGKLLPSGWKYFQPRLEALPA